MWIAYSIAVYGVGLLVGFWWGRWTWSRELKAYKEQQPCDTSMEQALLLEVIDKFLPTECDDAISREAVLNEFYDMENLYERIKQLPSVSTTKNIVNHGTQKSGKWIERQNIARTSIATAIEFRWTYECSECGHEVRHKTRFCASCGCRMESDGE